MDYRPLGRTGILASQLGMGSEGLVGMPTQTAVELIHAAIDNGVNYFDLYNPQPEVRESLAKGIGANRERVYIQGHLCTAWVNGQYTRTRSLPLVKQSFEEMLSALGTDYIDVGMIHYVDKEADLEEIFQGDLIQYVLDLKKQGRIRHIGISSHNPLVARKAVETGLVEVVLFAINPAYDMQPPSEDLERLWDSSSYADPLQNIDPQRDAFHKLCAVKGVGITVMKAFGGGDLLDARLSPFERALTPSQCIHYALSRPGSACVLGGFRSVDELQQSLHYFEASPEERDFAPVLSHIPKHTFFGKCMYCGHCAPCTAGIDIASVNKFHDLCVAQGFIPETVREHYKSLSHHASECIRCGACLRNCPFGVDILRCMEKAQQTFGF